MQSLFPTKKFFLILFFLILLAGGVFGLFRLSNNKTAQNLSLEQKSGLVPSYRVAGADTELKIATSTADAVATVVYLSEQTKANGATFSEITASVAKQIQAAKKKLDTDTYTIKDIKTMDDNSVEALRKYGDTMAKIFLYFGKDKQSSTYLEIIKKALETGDKKELEKIDPYILFLKNNIRMSLYIAVPSSASSVHLNIINGYAETLALLEGFRTLFDDVPAAIAAHSRLEKSAQRFIDSFKEADAFFKQKGVVFVPNENGDLFAAVAGTRPK